MERRIKINAKSKDEALKKAVEIYSLDINNIVVNEIEAPSNGFLGLFSKPGLYEISIKSEKEEEEGKANADKKAAEETVKKAVENKPVKEKVQAAEKTVETVSENTAAISKEDAGEDVTEEVKTESLTEEQADKEEMDFAEQFIKTILSDCNINAEVNIRKEGNIIKINIKGDEASALIGRRGETLDSIQFLTGLALNKIRKNSHSRVVVDIENYRSKREESLKKYAMKAAREVAKYKRPKKLDYMNPYERRIVHSSLQNDRYVVTHSEGNDPYRRVVIELKKR